MRRGAAVGPARSVLGDDRGVRDRPGSRRTGVDAKIPVPSPPLDQPRGPVRRYPVGEGQVDRGLAGTVVVDRPVSRREGIPRRLHGSVREGRSRHRGRRRRRRRGHPRVRDGRERGNGGDRLVADPRDALRRNEIQDDDPVVDEGIRRGVGAPRQGPSRRRHRGLARRGGQRGGAPPLVGDLRRGSPAGGRRTRPSRSEPSGGAGRHRGADGVSRPGGDGGVLRSRRPRVAVPGLRRRGREGKPGFVAGSGAGRRRRGGRWRGLVLGRPALHRELRGAERGRVRRVLQRREGRRRRVGRVAGGVPDRGDDGRAGRHPRSADPRDGFRRRR
mmetsp:Transcript_9053/g.22143  ORF Transcript_9053/g.22143 Transcript_9053/m.22143 type:complete len:330 (-) Transcript_9053:434-1423(-)